MTSLPPDLRADIVSSGYFPEFVADTVDQAIAGEQVVDWLVHHEATFSSTALHRHVTVLVITPNRFIVGHTDDGEDPSVPQALTTVETVALRHIRSVSLTQVVSHPERYGRNHGTGEAWLVANWGAVRRQEIEPASCGDPNCDADHGWSTQDLADDLTVRISAAADGQKAVERLIRFTATLQRMAG